MGLTTDVAHYLRSVTYDGLPPEVRSRAKHHVLDTIGVLLAGVDGAAPQTVRRSEVFVPQTDGQATVFGTGLRASVAVAALANGVAAHALDYDDTSFVLIAHTSGSAVPVMLNLAEMRGLSGGDVLTSLVAGYEAATRLSAAIMPTMYVRGWHTTGTLGVICATLSASHIAGLSEEKAANALGIATSMSSGLRANFGSYTKALHTGHAAQAGIQATLLAESGLTSSSPALEHEYGFYAVTVGAENVNLEATLTALADDRWTLVDPGIGFKLFPCNSAVLPGIESTLKLVTEHNILPGQIDHIDYGYTDLARTIVPFDDPQNSPEGQYSMTHAVAVAALFRKAGIREFSDEVVVDPEVAGMRRKVRPYQHPKLIGTSDGHDVPASEVTIHLTDGRSFTRFQQRPTGYPGGDKITWDDIVAKFRACTAERLGTDQANQVVDLVDHLEQVQDIRELIRLIS